MRCRNIRPVSAVCLLALVAGVKASYGSEPAIRPFEDRIVRPVPGYTAACTKKSVTGSRPAETGVEVVEVTANGEGSRVRRLLKRDDDITVELEALYDPAGRLVDTPSMRFNGEAVNDDEDGALPDLFEKTLIGPLYTGRPVSSGDRAAVSITREEMQALFDKITGVRFRVDDWVDDGRVHGLVNHDPFGEVIAVEWVFRTTLSSDRGMFAISGRGMEYFDTASGLLVSAFTSIRGASDRGDIEMTRAYQCRYVVTP